jgi:3'(2'), 5'-bisphosphate nucleotidase
VTPADLAALRGVVASIARRAGDAILRVYESDFAVTHKDDRSPLTEADLAAHRVIDAALGELDATLPVLSEESARILWSQRREWQRYWLVDPLDGTREFVKRNGEFTVNIALIERGEPVLGVVHAPVRGELAHGARGLGASMERPGAAPRELVTQPRPAGALRVAGSRSHGDPRMVGFLERVGAHEMVSLGSSLKFLLLADGTADVYLRYGPTSEWDTAAGQAVLEAAGGRVTDLALARLRYNTKDSLLNPDFVAVADPTLDLARLL